MAESGEECPTCGECFDTVNGMKVHHHAAHGESISGVEIECAHCGKSNRVDRNRAESADNVFCDSECMGAWQSENRVGEDHHSYAQIEVECHTCGNTFTEHRFRVKEQDRFFCDQDCYAEACRGSKRPDTRERITVECDGCGASTEKRPSRIEKTELHFCDADCFQDWASTNMVGESSPRWKGGYHGYGPGWNEQKKRAVRNRDGNRCVDCGMTSEEHLKEHKQKLHVHHIQPARGFDDPEKRNAMSNLVTMCQSCHFGKWEGIPLRPISAHGE